MIDLHCHVLPGIDDGPSTMDDAVEIVAAAAQAGTTTMVATPHVSWDYPANDAALIAGLVADVNAAVAERGIEVEVKAGAEIALTRTADLSDDELTALRLGGGRWLLVEPPFTAASSGFETLFSSLVNRGHEIVIAHPERIVAFQRDPAIIERLVRGGMLTSVTAGSLVGRFGKDVRRFTLDLMRKGLVHNVASDAHSVVRRPPGMATELECEGLGAHTERLTLDVPAAILNGTSIPRLAEGTMVPAGQGGRLGRLLRRA